MRSLRQVEHKHLVGDGLSKCTGQFHRCFLEFPGVQDRFHRNDRRLGIRHLDTYRTLTGDRSDDTDTEGSQRQSDIVFQVLDLRDSHARSQSNLVKRNGRSDGGLDTGNLHTKRTEHLHDTVLVGRLLGHIDIRLAVVLVSLQQVKGRILIVLQVAFGVVGLKVLKGGSHSLCVCFIFCLSHLNLHAHLVFFFHHFLRCLLRLWLLVAFIYDNSLIVFLEFNGLRSGVVKYLRIFFFIHLLLVRIYRFIGIVVCNLKFNLIKELAWVQ